MAGVFTSGDSRAEEGSNRSDRDHREVGRRRERPRSKGAREIFDDELIVTTFDGRLRGKTAELEAMRPNPNARMVSVANEDVAKKVMGDAVVVTALFTNGPIGWGKGNARRTAIYGPY